MVTHVLRAIRFLLAVLLAIIVLASMELLAPVLCCPVRWELITPLLELMTNLFVYRVLLALTATPRALLCQPMGMHVVSECIVLKELVSMAPRSTALLVLFATSQALLAKPTVFSVLSELSAAWARYRLSAVRPTFTALLVASFRRLVHLATTAPLSISMLLSPVQPASTVLPTRLSERCFLNAATEHIVLQPLGNLFPVLWERISIQRQPVCIRHSPRRAYLVHLEPTPSILRSSSAARARLATFVLEKLVPSFPLM